MSKRHMIDTQLQAKRSKISTIDLLTLPYELRLEVWLYLRPGWVTNIRLTCKQLNDEIVSEEKIWELQIIALLAHNRMTSFELEYTKFYSDKTTWQDELTAFQRYRNIYCNTTSNLTFYETQRGRKIGNHCFVNNKTNVCVHLRGLHNSDHPSYACKEGIAHTSCNSDQFWLHYRSKKFHVVDLRDVFARIYIILFDVSEKYRGPSSGMIALDTWKCYCYNVSGPGSFVIRECHALVQHCSRCNYSREAGQRGEFKMLSCVKCIHDVVLE